MQLIEHIGTRSKAAGESARNAGTAAASQFTEALSADSEKALNTLNDTLRARPLVFALSALAVGFIGGRILRR